MIAVPGVTSRNLEPDKTGYSYEHEGNFSVAKVTIILYCDA